MRRPPRLITLLTLATFFLVAAAARAADGNAWTIPWALLVAIVVLSGLVATGLAFRPRRRY